MAAGGMKLSLCDESVSNHLVGGAHSTNVLRHMGSSMYSYVEPRNHVDNKQMPKEF